MKRLLFALCLFSSLPAFAIHDVGGSGGGSSGNFINNQTTPQVATFNVSSGTASSFYVGQISLFTAGNVQGTFSPVSDGSVLLTGSNNTFNHVLDLYNSYPYSNPSYARYSNQGFFTGQTTLGYAGFGTSSNFDLRDNTGALFVRFGYGSVPSMTIGDATRDSFISFGNAAINFDAAPTPLLFTGSPFVFNASVTTNAPIVANSTIQVNNMMMDSSGSVGTLNQVLASQGAGVPPKWQAQSGSGGGGYNVEPASVTFLLDKGVRVSTLNVNGSTLTINGITYTNWPSSLSGFANTSSGVFVVNGSSQVSIQPAITDPAETGITNTFISSNTFNAAVGMTTEATLPHGTNPTTSTTGDMAVDTSSGQVVASTNGSSGNVVLPYYIPNSIVIATPTVGDYHFFVKAKREWTVDSVVCVSSASTSATVQLFECDANGANCTSMDSATACTTTETAITMTDTDITAGDRVKVMVTATSGTPGEVVVDLYALETRK